MSDADLWSRELQMVALLRPVLRPSHVLELDSKLNRSHTQIRQLSKTQLSIFYWLVVSGQEMRGNESVA